MNILLVNYEYPPLGAGAANAAWNIAKNMARLGHCPVVLTARHRGLPGRQTQEGVKIRRVPVFRKKRSQSNPLEMASFLGSGLIHLPAVIKRDRIETAIVFFSLPCGPIGLAGRLLFNVPYVVSLRGGDVPGNEPGLDGFHRILTPLRRTVLRRAVAVTANSKGLKDEAMVADPGPVRVIPNGVDTDFFRPSSRKANPFRFLFVGRLQHQKNPAFLLDQTKRLADQTNVPFELHMVGAGPLRPGINALIESLGLSGRVILHGWLHGSALREQYHLASCLVNASLYEGHSNVILEAMSCGLPVIASRVTGNTDLVRDKVSGYVFDLDQPHALSRIMMEVLENPDPSLGLEGRRLVEKHYSWETTAREYIRLFE